MELLVELLGPDKAMKAIGLLAASNILLCMWQIHTSAKQKREHDRLMSLGNDEGKK